MKEKNKKKLSRKNISIYIIFVLLISLIVLKGDSYLLYITKNKVKIYLFCVILIVTIYFYKTSKYKFVPKVKEEKTMLLTRKDEYKELQNLKRGFVNKIFGCIFGFSFFLMILNPIDIVKKFGIINYEIISIGSLTFLGLCGECYLTEIKEKEIEIGCKNKFDNSLLVIITKMFWTYLVSYNFIVIIALILKDL